VRVFITGATGFVGSHVARSYAAGGAQLRLLTRQTSRLDSLAGLSAETVVGDLREPEKLRSALAGCDALVHVAADYRLWVRDPKEMYAANVDGTRELLRLAREAGVERVVYTSSVATMGFKADGTIVNEDTPVSLTDMIGHYKRSKFLAEQEAIKAAWSDSARDDSESDHADWARRCEAHADGQDHRRFPQPQISRLRRYRTEPGGC